MKIHEIKAKSLIRRHRKIDSWFVSKYGMNLYRGCTHNCVYCDGRSEKYQVNGIFGSEVDVKINAIELLKKEMNVRRRKKFYKNGFIMVGGGVGDSYQPVEKKYELTRKTLKILRDAHLPIHLLTKSTLVSRDIDLLKQIDDQNKAIISFSFSSTNDEISGIFEPGVPAPSERLETIKQLKQEGFSIGMFLLPVLPFITDTPSYMKQSIKDASLAGIDFIIFGGMTLKPGNQQKAYYHLLEKKYPDLIPSYQQIYKGDQWGNAIGAYYKSLSETFQSIMTHYPIPKRLPASLFNDVINDNHRIVIILEQIDYLLRLQGRKSPYGFASYNISQLKDDIVTMKHHLQQIKGVGEVTEKIILEILETKTSSYYEKLLKN